MRHSSFYPHLSSCLYGGQSLEQGLSEYFSKEAKKFLNHLDVAYETGRTVFDHISKHR